MNRANATWRAGDQIIFSQMRSALAELEALLLRLARASTVDNDSLNELMRTRALVMTVDGFDREAVVRQLDAIQARVVELRAESS